MPDAPKHPDHYDPQTLELARAGAFLGGGSDLSVAADVVAHVAALLRAMG